MPIAKVGEINMYYQIHGEGEPLVLIQGLGADLGGWALYQTPVFSKQYQVIVFDTRGVGRTDAKDKPFSIGIAADDTAGLLDALNIERAHILGMSQGGMIAQELALKYPQRIKSLILAATTARSSALSSYVIDTWVRMVQEGISQETVIRDTLVWLFTDRFFQNPELVQLAVDNMLNDPYTDLRKSIVQQVGNREEFDNMDRISQITAPTLVLVGNEDILLPVKLSEELVARIPNAELVILDGGGHGFSLEIPDKFNKAVLEFLAKVDKD
jgi:pimeloyl-ACP methyl ester carboxylesterase